MATRTDTDKIDRNAKNNRKTDKKESTEKIKKFSQAKSENGLMKLAKPNIQSIESSFSNILEPSPPPVPGQDIPILNQTTDLEAYGVLYKPLLSVVAPDKTEVIVNKKLRRDKSNAYIKVKGTYKPLDPTAYKITSIRDPYRNDMISKIVQEGQQLFHDEEVATDADYRPVKMTTKISTQHIKPKKKLGKLKKSLTKLDTLMCKRCSMKTLAPTTALLRKDSFDLYKTLRTKRENGGSEDCGESSCRGGLNRQTREEICSKLSNILKYLDNLNTIRYDVEKLPQQSDIRVKKQLKQAIDDFLNQNNDWCSFQSPEIQLRVQEKHKPFKPKHKSSNQNCQVPNVNIAEKSSKFRLPDETQTCDETPTECDKICDSKELFKGCENVNDLLKAAEKYCEEGELNDNSRKPTTPTEDCNVECLDAKIEECVNQNKLSQHSQNINNEAHCDNLKVENTSEESNLQKFIQKKLGCKTSDTRINYRKCKKGIIKNNAECQTSRTALQKSPACTTNRTTWKFCKKEKSLPDLKKKTSYSFAKEHRSSPEVPCTAQCDKNSCLPNKTIKSRILTTISGPSKCKGPPSKECTNFQCKIPPTTGGYDPSIFAKKCLKPTPIIGALLDKDQPPCHCTKVYKRKGKRKLRFTHYDCEKCPACRIEAKMYKKRKNQAKQSKKVGKCRVSCRLKRKLRFWLRWLCCGYL